MTRPSAVSAAAMAAPTTGVRMITAESENTGSRRRCRGALPPATGRTRRRRRERSRLADIILSRGTIQRIDIDLAANTIPVFEDGIVRDRIPLGHSTPTAKDVTAPDNGMASKRYIPDPRILFRHVTRRKQPIGPGARGHEPAGAPGHDGQVGEPGDQVAVGDQRQRPVESIVRPAQG